MFFPSMLLHANHMLAFMYMYNRASDRVLEKNLNCPGFGGKLCRKKVDCAGNCAGLCDFAANQRCVNKSSVSKLCIHFMHHTLSFIASL